METKKICWAKVHPQAVIPQRRSEDAGYDLYACFEQDYMEFAPLETRLVPLGVASAFDQSYVLFLKERGSTGIKGISVRAGVIDSGYRGEYMAALTNLNTKPLRIIKKEALDAMTPAQQEQYVLYPYEKACVQGVLLTLPEEESQEISLAELLAIPSGRGAGRLGSSGK